MRAETGPCPCVGEREGSMQVPVLVAEDGSVRIAGGRLNRMTTGRA